MACGASDGSGRQPNAIGWPPKWLPPLAVAVILLIWPIVIFGARQAWLNHQNRVEDWLPASFPETQSLEKFSKRFGNDEFLMISWPECHLDDSRCDQLIQKMLSPASDGKIYFAKAFSGQDLLQSLKTSQPAMDERLLRLRLAGLFIGKDLEQSSVVALVSRAGLDDRSAAIDWAWQAAEQATKLARDEIHMAGSTADSVAVDAASERGLVELNLLSSFLCFVILLASLRNIWLVGTVFFGALLNEHLALAIIHFSGAQIDTVLLLVANLSFVLSISAGLHYLGYFYAAEREGKVSPAWAALQASFLPSLLAAATTSMGFISLCTSEIVPIRRFGIYAATVVPINAFLIVTILVIHATWASRRNWRWQLVPSSSLYTKHFRLVHIFVSKLQKYPRAILSIWLVTVVVCGAGITRLTTSVGTHKLLPSDDKLLRDYAWLESKIGPLVPIEFVIRFDRNDLRGSLERIHTLDVLRRELHRVPSMLGSWSVINLLPPLSESRGIRGVIERSILGKSIENSRQHFQDMRLLFENENEQCWRISGRVSGANAPNYEQLLADADRAIVRFRQQVSDTTIQIDISGGIPFVYRTQRQLLIDLLSSFSTAFAMIAVTMMLLFRSIRAGLLSMLPNVTPAAFIFGLMGWFGMEVELGTVLTASVIMGVCVDDTLHLISHFCMLRMKGLEPVPAIEYALANSGGAMLQTATVCGVGMLVFAFSPFTPIARFGWLTFVLLMVGLVSDLILTPAILLTPLHRCFFREAAPQLDSGPPP